MAAPNPDSSAQHDDDRNPADSPHSTENAFAAAAPIEVVSEPVGEVLDAPRPFDACVKCLATGFGLGFSPIVPGTVGCLPAIGIGWWWYQADVELWLRWVVVGVLFAAGIYVADRAAQLIGRHDPGSVVIDEIAAQSFVYAFFGPTPRQLLIGFVWFRIFDITKPFPARRAEGLPGGLGIMADDMMAAVYAAVAVFLTEYAIT